MLAPTHRLDAPAASSVGQYSQLILILLLGSLLAFATLTQIFFVIPNPRLFVRWGELLFIGIFLFESRRSFDAPLLKPSLVGWLFLGWIVSASISVILAVNTGHALLRHAEWLTHFLFAVTLWSFLKQETLAFKAILLALPVGFLLVGLHTLAIWLSLPNPRSYDWFYHVPLAGHIRHLGYYGLAALIFSASPLLGLGPSITWRERLAAFIGLTICWGFLFWTGGRAAIGSGIVGLVLMTWFASKDKRAWTFFTWIVAAGLGLWLSTFFWTENPNMGFFNSIERTAEASSSHGVNGFTTGRLTIWEVTLRGVEGRPWFGLGPDGYKFIPEPHHGIQPHGMFIQFIVEWGIMGTIPFLLLLGLVFWKGFKRTCLEQIPLRKTARIAALALVIACTLHSFVDGLYYHSQPLLFLFTCFAIALLPVSSSSSESTASPAPVRMLTARVTLWIAWGLLALIFLANSDFVYMLF